MRLPFIPYFQTTKYRVEAMIELAQIKPGEKAADLGSGDGRIVIALAQAGAQAIGYELDSTLKELAEVKIRQANIDATILQKDFWTEDLSPFDVITIYPMPDIMEALEKKLLKELRSGSRVLVNYYPFPTWENIIKKDNIFLYKR